MSQSLKRLVHNDNTIIEDRIAEILEPIISFTDSGEILPEKNFSRLNSTNKVLTIVLSMKALNLLKIRPEERVGPTEISNLSGIPLGTVKREVRSSEREGILRSENGKYWVPIHNLRRISQLITLKEK